MSHKDIQFLNYFIFKERGHAFGLGYQYCFIDLKTQSTSNNAFVIMPKMC